MGPARLFVIAGPNGGGKSSVAGSQIADAGTLTFDPDRVASELRRQHPQMGQPEANSAAWRQMVADLDRAIVGGETFTFETTLGGNTIHERLLAAAVAGAEVSVWFVALESAQMHIERVRQRVARGGHPVPDADVIRRYDRGREHLVELMPHLKRLMVFDNSAITDVDAGALPSPRHLLSMTDGVIDACCATGAVPEWARVILDAAQSAPS